MSYFIDTFLEPVLWFAAEWSLRWGALLAVVALILWIVRPRRAALRQLFLLSALAAGVLMPFTPRWGYGWQRTHQRAEPSLSPSFPRSAWERTTGRSASRPVSTPDATRSVAPVRSYAERGNERSEPQPTETSEPLGHHRLIVLGIASCWSFAVLYLLVRRLSGWFVLRRLRRQSVEATGATADLFAACRAELGMRKKVRLAAHPRVRSPILFGFLRPLILIPPNWPQEDLETPIAGLLHELAHVRRRDHLFAPLLEIVRIAFFFHPLLRWLLARLEYERELLCDEMVVRRGIDPRSYARLLLEFARASGRLTCPAATLSMSRRRTVKGRIDHLLEEDMERWIRPLSARWTVVLGSSLLALSLGLVSYRVWAEEKEKTEAPANKGERQPTSNKSASAPIKREDLRYAGKDFYQWRRDLLTELKPAIRADGLLALGTFGVNGYGTEATQAILDMMRGYDPAIEHSVHEDAPVVKAGYKAIEKIRTASVPALAAAVKDENRNVRRFATSALGRLRSDAQAALPTLLQAFKNDDAKTRTLAIEAVGMIGQGTKEVIAALIELLKDKNVECRVWAIVALGWIGESAKPAIPELLIALSDKEPSVRGDAINALKEVGAGANAVFAIRRLLRDEDKNVSKQAFWYLKQLKPEEAKEAIPALIAILKSKDYERIPEAVATLKYIGPTAKEAIPALSELLRREKELRGKVYGNPRDNLLEALKAIDPEDNR